MIYKTHLSPLGQFSHPLHKNKPQTQIFQQFFFTDTGVQTEVQPGKVIYQYSLHFCNYYYIL